MPMRMAPVDRAQLHAVFLEAFADYATDASQMTEEHLRIRCAKNQVDYDRSVGAFDGDRMIGFTLIGIDDWQGERAAFDAGTGIVAAFRGQGLAKGMFDHATPMLREIGVRRFLLEVLQANKPAIRAYRKAGFEITRELRCFELDPATFAVPPRQAAGIHIRTVDRPVILSLADQADWQPSWENSFAGIARIPDDLVTLGAFDGEACVGGITFSPVMGWILTLVVRRSHRRRGSGSALVEQLIGRLPSDTGAIRVVNVDAGDHGMPAFLEQLGFRHWVDQYEMERPL
jgi:ribosomal protein S18 acetylase RimI-like enzyme